MKAKTILNKDGQNSNIVRHVFVYLAYWFNHPNSPGLGADGKPLTGGSGELLHPPGLVLLHQRDKEHQAVAVGILLRPLKLPQALADLSKARERK